MTCVAVGAMLVAGAWAESITHGTTTINMDFVDIGYAGNDADFTGYGSVGYNYKIGKFEVTAAQWNAVRAADSNVGNAGSWSGPQPTASSSWYEAAKFANWLTTGNAYSGAYQFNGSGTLTSVMTRAQIEADGGLFYVLPTEDEWYKAAYLKSDGSAYTTYATGNAIPTEGAGGENYDYAIGSPWNVGTGAVENNGTYDMNGNVWEWNESAFDGTLDNMAEDRVWRGGAFGISLEFNLRSPSRVSLNPTLVGHNIGFRVAAIPEPSSIAMIGLVGGCAVFIRRTFMI